MFDFSQAWAAESPAALFQINFVQIGHALRGTMVEQLADGKIVNGKIVSGAVNDKTVLFGVELTTEGAGSNSPSLTLEFDCSFNERLPAITCNYTNEKGERGSAIFEPVAP